MRASPSICFFISTFSLPSSPSEYRSLTNSNSTSTSCRSRKKTSTVGGWGGRLTIGLEGSRRKVSSKDPEGWVITHQTKPLALAKHLSSSSKPKACAIQFVRSNEWFLDENKMTSQLIELESPDVEIAERQPSSHGKSIRGRLHSAKSRVKKEFSSIVNFFKTSTSQSHREGPRVAEIEGLEISVADSLPSDPLPRPSEIPSDPLPRPSEMNKLYLFLFFWHAYSPVMYSLYKVDVQIPPPPPSAVQDSPKKLSPILKLKTGKYADGMCCVQLGSKLCFMGGEMNIDNPHIGKDVKELLEKEPYVKKLPNDVYYFELAIDHNYAGELEAGTPMNCGKARPLAFVANENIYVIGSTNQYLDEHHAYFEKYDPKVDGWEILPNPPIKNVNTIWVRHVVVGRKALMVAWQQEKERLYCYDFYTQKWANTSIPDYPGNFSGNTEFVGNRLYGCYYNTIAAIAPLKEEEEEAEEKELQQLFKHHCLHQVSKEMGMDAILKIPPQVQYSSRLLHLREKRFCYVRTGMPPHPDPDLARDLVIGDDKKRFISIVIFDAVGDTYKKDDTRFFEAKFLHSEHYEVNTPFPNEGFIKAATFLARDT